MRMGRPAGKRQTTAQGMTIRTSIVRPRLVRRLVRRLFRRTMVSNRTLPRGLVLERVTLQMSIQGMNL